MAEDVLIDNCVEGKAGTKAAEVDFDSGVWVLYLYQGF